MGHLSVQTSRQVPAPCIMVVFSSSVIALMRRSARCLGESNLFIQGRWAGSAAASFAPVDAVTARAGAVADCALAGTCAKRIKQQALRMSKTALLNLPISD